jgi:flagellar basal-body rod protein FlgB
VNFTSTPLLSLLDARMTWLNARQAVLSENVANADTPGYMAKDLKPQNFSSYLSNGVASLPTPALERANPRQLPGVIESGQQFSEMQSPDGQANPTGNTVNIDQEMMKVSKTQEQYQAASDLYAKSIVMMRTAIGQP